MAGGAGFIRRWLEDPGDDVLLDIESVNIIDGAPPPQRTGIGTGTALLVGEFEEGDFDTPEEHVGDTDFKRMRGDFGFTHASLPHQAISARRHGGEFFNGNGFLALVGKKFKRLITVRVDTSVGEVSFWRLASLLGNTKLTWDLTTGQHLDFEVDGVAAAVATFTGTPAAVTGAAFVSPTLFVGGEFIDLQANALAPVVRVIFLGADQLIAACIARINAYMGFAFADLSGGQIRLTSNIGGTDGDVIIAAGGTATVTLGLVAGTTAGAGNVANIDAVTVAELNTIVSAATGTDVLADRNGDGYVRAFNNQTTDGTGRLELLVGSTADDFGFTEVAEDDANATTNTGGTILAGTRVTNGVTTWVTMQTLAFPDGAGSQLDVAVRPADDDGTALGGLVNAVNTLTDQPTFACFAVRNLSALTVALTEAQVDARYYTAIDSTLNINNVARESNFIWSARTSNNVSRKLWENALAASANGCFGRKAVIRAPMGTTRALASGDPQPGVGATRNQRVYFVWPQWSVYVPQIARAGAANGGDGFVDDGIVDLGADGFLVSIMCQMKPEQNPGELTDMMASVVGLESAVPTNMGIAEYKALKAAGICAPRLVGSTPIYQSGVTSVNPSTDATLKNISRRNMADYVQDSLQLLVLPYQKKVNTLARRNAIAAIIDGFLDPLRSTNDPAKQRISGYTNRDVTTAEMEAAGMYRRKVKVRLLGTLDSIVLDTQIGETVDITESGA